MKIIVCSKCKTPYMDSEKCCPNCGEGGEVINTIATGVSEETDFQISEETTITKEQRRFIWAVIVGFGFHLVTILWYIFTEEVYDDIDYIGPYYEELSGWLGVMPYVLFDAFAIYFYLKINKKEQINISSLLIVLVISCGYYVYNSVYYLHNSISNYCFIESNVYSAFRCFLWCSAFALAVKETKDRKNSNIPFYLVISSIIIDFVKWSSYDHFTYGYLI